MIVRDKPELRHLLTAIRGSILPQVARPVLFLAAMSLAVLVADHATGLVPHLDGQAFAVFGIGLSLFLGFRNNAAYDRWWEARRLWGGLLADLRALSREAAVFWPETAGRQAFLRQALVFVHAHRLNLRRVPPAGWQGAAQVPDAVRPGLAQVAGAPHPPDAALDAMAGALARAVAAGAVDGFGARALTARLGSIAQAQAGAERIGNSPLPYVYSLLIYRTTYLYGLLLPMALAQTTGWLTPVFVAVVAYMFLGLAEVSEELAHPFSAAPNCVPLDAICRAAEISLAPHLDEAAPPALRPVDHYLG